MNIYVGNLSPEVNEEELNGLFAEYGQVSSAKVIRDMFSQESRGFGFVEMPGQVEEAGVAEVVAVTAAEEVDDTNNLKIIFIQNAAFYCGISILKCYSTKQ
jgi:hypothetical protein